MSKAESSSKAAAALAAAYAVMLVLIGVHVLADWTKNWDYNAIRLERSFVLAMGEPIYSDADSGLILNTIYGPVGALAYLPATLMRTPAAAVLAGQALSLVFLLLPAAVLVRGRAFGVFGFLLIAALVIDVYPLEYVAFTIHVDAPALALGALSWAALLRAFPRSAPPSPSPRQTRWLVAAALFASLGVWTKLMLLPLLAALPLGALALGGRRPAVRLAVILAAVLAAVSALMVLAFGPLDRLVFNLWTVPSRHSSGQDAIGPQALLRGTRRLLFQGLPVWTLWLIVVAARLARRREVRASDPVLAFGALGIALAPVSVLGLLKAGGDVNAFSYTLYPVVLGSVLSLLDEARRSVWMRRLLLGLPAFLLLAAATFQEPELLATWRSPPRMSELPHQIAFEYARKHPGEMYFPRLTLASLMAEGRAYHQLVGIIDREIAGFPPTLEHLRAHLPENMKGFAFADNGFSAEAGRLIFLGFRREETDPELPGFIVYRPEAPGEPTPPLTPADSSFRRRGGSVVTARCVIPPVRMERMVGIACTQPIRAARTVGFRLYPTIRPARTGWVQLYPRLVPPSSGRARSGRPAPTQPTALPRSLGPGSLGLALRFDSNRCQMERANESEG